MLERVFNLLPPFNPQHAIQLLLTWLLSHGSWNMCFYICIERAVSRESTGVWECWWQKLTERVRKNKKNLIAIAWMMAFCFHTWVAIFPLLLNAACDIRIICDWCDSPLLYFCCLKWRLQFNKCYNNLGEATKGEITWA